MESTGRPLELFCDGPLPAVVAPWTPADAPANDAAHVFFAKLTDHTDELDALADLLDLHERDRAARFRFAPDRERYIIGHGLMRRALGQQLGMDPAAIVLHRGIHGKPFVQGTDLQFNLSDTKDAVIMAFLNGSAIGADVETMQRRTDHALVGTHYFTPGEVSDIAAAMDGKRRFLELWTRKEAVLKACGVGIMEDLRSLRVDRPHNALIISHPEFVRMADDAYHVRTFHVGEQHLISLAAPRPMPQVVFTAFPG